MFRRRAGSVFRYACGLVGRASPAMVEGGHRPLHLVGKLAECAQGTRGHLTTTDALVEGDVLRPREGGARPFEEAEEEIMLGPRRGYLHAVQDLLVRDGGRPLGEGALL